jgi:hypothetical protein
MTDLAGYWSPPVRVYSGFILKMVRSFPFPGSKPPIEIVSLCRDEQGRLWAASHTQIYVSSNEGESWEVVALPMLASTFVARIRRSRQNPHGIVLARDDSIVFLEW